jgi:hypothetical protein
VGTKKQLMWRFSSTVELGVVGVCGGKFWLNCAIGMGIARVDQEENEILKGCIKFGRLCCAVAKTKIARIIRTMVGAVFQCAQGGTISGTFCTIWVKLLRASKLSVSTMMETMNLEIVLGLLKEFRTEIGASGGS